MDGIVQEPAKRDAMRQMTREAADRKYGEGHVSNRVTKELAQLLDGDVFSLERNGYCFELVDDDVRHVRAIIDGPVGTAYEGGTFRADILVPEEYPLQPPTVRMLTKMYHSNVSADGEVVLEILAGKWTPSLRLHLCIGWLHAVLCDASIRHNNALHDAVARVWTWKHAGGAEPSPEVQRLASSRLWSTLRTWVGGCARHRCVLAQPHDAHGRQHQAAGRHDRKS